MLNTLSSLISFHSRMEDNISEYYISLAEEHLPDHKEKFLGLAEESKRFKGWVRRAYQEGITDAFEVSYIKGELRQESYLIEKEISTEVNRQQLIQKAIELEGSSRRFCLDAAKSSGGVLAELPHTLERVAKRKERNIEELKSLL